MGAKLAIPILRSFDETKAREFYVDYLGFKITFEHRFDSDAPLYLGLIMDEVELHISEHYGDATPGSTIRIEMDNIGEFHKSLMTKEYKYARPGIQDQEWGQREVSINDPFGNKLVFCQPLESLVETRKNRPAGAT